MQPQLQPERVPAPNPISGLLTIFYSPAEAFASCGRRGWIVPLVAACILVLVMNAVVVNRIGIGTLVRNQLEANATFAERLGPDGISKAVERAETSSFQKVMTYIGAPIGITVVLLVLSAVYLGCLLVGGGSTKFSAVFTSMAWSTYAVLAVTCAGSIASVYSMTDFSGVDMQRLFQLNAGLFAGESGPVTRALLSGIDLLAFWGIFINCVGFTKLSERVSTGLALGVLILGHIVVTCLRAGWAAMFG